MGFIILPQIIFPISARVYMSSATGRERRFVNDTIELTQSLKSKDLNSFYRLSCTTIYVIHMYSRIPLTIDLMDLRAEY
jgi:hypothetical protein